MRRAAVIIMMMMIFSGSYGQDRPSVVPDVDLNRYQGTWYEIARLPFRFEAKLKCITATYTLREDGRINVLNSGHLKSDPGTVSKARAVAFIPDSKVPAKLKVQFFWPFKGNYWIMELDSNYRYVMIGEPSFKYLWILSREKELDSGILESLKKKAAEAGYNLSDLIMTEHDCP